MACEEYKQKSTITWIRFVSTFRIPVDWYSCLELMQQFSFQKDLSKTLLMYTVPAVQGFFRSISLSRGNNLQDTLRYVIKVSEI